MKTKLRILQSLLVAILLLGGVMNGMAQTNQSPKDTVCVGNQPYLVSPSSLPNPTYTWAISPGTDGVEWQINGTTNSITVDWNVPGIYTLSVFTTSKGCSGPAQQVEITVVAQPVGPTLLAQLPAATVCDGTLVSATFNPGSGGVGCADEYQYSYDGSGVWVAYTPGTDITTTGHTSVEIQGRRDGCITGSGCTGTAWVTLATWTITAPLTVTVNITASADDVCEGTEVTYTANVTNGGTPTYEWHVNGGTTVLGTDATFVYTPVIGDEITCIVVSNATCASTAPVTGTFNPIVNPKPNTSAIFHN